ncbi:MAG: hypothetical protein H6719_29950 [Sandaracinaceae bacterium]|nr:hypothetical protein [Sandaracinaceae bacterium]
MSRTYMALLGSLALGACGARTGLSLDVVGRDAGTDDAAAHDGGPSVSLDAGVRFDAGVLPPLDRPFVQIRAGRDHTCALDEDGRVLCWGDNRNRELALDVVVGDSLVPVPIDVPPTVALDAGHDQSCGIDVDGRLWCWGTVGPDGTTTGPAPMSGLGDVVDVGVGSASVCTLGTRSNVLCGGELGARDGAWSERVTRGARMVSVGSNHACALVDADVRCFGHNPTGELGVPPFIGAPWEGAPTTVPGVRDPTSVSAGFDHSCASTEGELYCWGSNALGQLGIEGIGNGVPPTPVPGLDGAEVVESGWSVTCAIRRGELWCWGDGSRGQLAVGAWFGAHPPVRVELPGPVRAVTVGVNHTCAIDGDGRPWCWGYNTRGQLGDGTRDDRTRPVPVRL